jgi:hypothetical protein
VDEREWPSIEVSCWVLIIGKQEFMLNSEDLKRLGKPDALDEPRHSLFCGISRRTSGVAMIVAPKHFAVANV